MSNLTQFTVTGKVAAVTGAGAGLGEGIAKMLARAGAAVACGDIDLAAAERTAAAIVAGGGDAVAVALDVRSRQAFDDFLDTAISQFGSLDILVNNAGITITVPPLEMSEEDFDEVISINLKGVFLGCQSAGLRIADGGSIVNMSSAVIDTQGVSSLVAYAASKAGVVQVTRAFALELGPRQVRVNAVAPGWVETAITRRHFADEGGVIDEGKRAAYIASRAARTPLNQVAEVDDIANMVLFLASDAGRYCSSTVFRVHGGMFQSP